MFRGNFFQNFEKIFLKVFIILFCLFISTSTTSEQVRRASDPARLQAECISTKIFTTTRGVSYATIYWSTENYCIILCTTEDIAIANVRLLDGFNNKFSFFSIDLFNNTNVQTSRTIQDGPMIKMDKCTYLNYCSDCTNTNFIWEFSSTPFKVIRGRCRKGLL